MDQHPSDMRIGVNGMCGQVRAVGLDPTNGDVYIFVGSSRKIMKLLHWERGGFAMYYKRLEQGRFPRAKAAKATPGSSWTACATTLPLTKSDRCCLITTRNRKDNPLRFLFFSAMSSRLVSDGYIIKPACTVACRRAFYDVAGQAGLLPNALIGVVAPHVRLLFLVGPLIVDAV